MLRSEANMFYSLTVSPGGHIKYDWVQTETDYILLWKNVGNTDSLALVLYLLYFKEGIIQQLQDRWTIEFI